MDFVEVNGTLDKVYVREGQTVKKGTLLAEFSNLDLQAEEESAKTRYNIAERMIAGYNAQLLLATDVQERRQLQQAIAKATGDMEAARRKWEMARKDNRTRLVLQAPRDGVVMGLPKVDEMGKRWEKDQSTPFCSVGDSAYDSRRRSHASHANCSSPPKRRFGRLAENSPSQTGACSLTTPCFLTTTSFFSSHTVLPIRWIEDEATGAREIWLADPSKPPLLRVGEDVSDGLEKIVIGGHGSWSYVRWDNGAWNPGRQLQLGHPTLAGVDPDVDLPRAAPAAVGGRRPRHRRRRAGQLGGEHRGRR